MYSFCPSDYLAIRTAPEILRLTFDSEEPVDHYQVFERKISQFFGTEAAIFFPDGYLALVALLRNLIQENDLIFIPSETDGAIPDAVEILQRHCESARFEVFSEIPETLPPNVSRVLILANGICEMSGKIAPVDQWSEWLNHLYEERKIPGIIILDDSLGVGLLGENYRGTFEHFGLTSNKLPNPAKGVQYFFSGSLNDAFGSSGGFLTGERKWLKGIRKNDPCCCAKAQIPLSNIVAATKALELAAEPERHEKMLQNVHFLTEKLAEAQIPCISNPLLPFVLIKVPHPKDFVKTLSTRGCRVSVTHFTRKPLLCAAVNPDHSESEIQFLVQTLQAVLKYNREKEKEKERERKNLDQSSSQKRKKKRASKD